VTREKKTSPTKLGAANLRMVLLAAVSPLTPVYRPAALAVAPQPVMSFQLSLLPSMAGSSRQQKKAVNIRRVSPEDRDELAELCTDCFFGEHEFSDGPVIYLQRQQTLQRVREQMGRRINFEGPAEDDRECRLLVAEDRESGEITGCLDLAVHLWDRTQQRFWLTIDTMPEENRGRFVWRPYLASVAVRKQDRRAGVARKLVREAEGVSRRWGYREIYLEVRTHRPPTRAAPRSAPTPPMSSRR
tara:strand:+ start:273 stop:1004 length:732 start_codon:yes stop_codon:yes gene_type:complete